MTMIFFCYLDNDWFHNWLWIIVPPSWNFQVGPILLKVCFYWPPYLMMLGPTRPLNWPLSTYTDTHTWCGWFLNLEWLRQFKWSRSLRLSIFAWAAAYLHMLCISTYIYYIIQLGETFFHKLNGHGNRNYNIVGFFFL